MGCVGEKRDEPWDIEIEVKIDETKGETQTTVRREDTFFFFFFDSWPSVPVRFLSAKIDPAAVSSLARIWKLLCGFCEQDSRS